MVTNLSSRQVCSNLQEQSRTFNDNIKSLHLINIENSNSLNFLKNNIGTSQNEGDKNEEFVISNKEEKRMDDFMFDKVDTNFSVLNSSHLNSSNSYSQIKKEINEINLEANETNRNGTHTVLRKIDISQHDATVDECVGKTEESPDLLNSNSTYTGNIFARNLNNDLFQKLKKEIINTKKNKESEVEENHSGHTPQRDNALFEKLKKEIIDSKKEIDENQIRQNDGAVQNNVNKLLFEQVKKEIIKFPHKKNGLFIKEKKIGRQKEEKKEENEENKYVDGTSVLNSIPCKSNETNIKSETPLLCSNADNRNHINLHMKPGKRYIRVEAIPNCLFKYSIYCKILENENELKKFHFLKNQDSYLKLFESVNNKDVNNVVKRMMNKNDENEVKIFDEHTYKNIFIIMKKLKTSMEQLESILTNMKANELFQEELELIESLIPSEKYVHELKNLKLKENWDDIKKNLRNTEKLLLPVCSINRVKSRIRMLKFYYNVEKIKNRLSELFSLYNKGCEELQNCSLLIEILQGILTWVNFVNYGKDDSFKMKSIHVSSLNILKNFKTNGFKHNALDYIIVNMISFDVLTKVDDITHIRDLLKKLQKLKGSEIVEEMNFIEKEIHYISEEMNHFKEEYSNVIVVLIKIMDKGKVIYNKLTTEMQITRDHILSLSSFYGMEETTSNNKIHSTAFLSSEVLFRSLYIFIDNVYNILNEIVQNPLKMNILLIDEKKKFGDFNNTHFYKNRMIARHKELF